MISLRPIVSSLRTVPARIAGLLLPGFVRRSFAAKFFTGVVLVVVITGSVGAYNYLAVDERMETNAEQELVATAELQGEGLNRWMNNIKLQTRMLSNQPKLAGNDQLEKRLYLEDTIYSGALPAEVEAIHVMSLSTTEVLVSSNREVEGTNLRNTGVQWAQKNLNTRLYNYNAVLVSQRAYDSPAIDADAVAIVSSLKESPNNAVVVVVNTTAVSKLFHQTANGAYTEVLNADGRPIISQRSDATRETVLNATNETSDETLLAAGLHGNSGYRVGTETVAGFAPVESEEWVLVTYAPKSAVFALKEQVTWSILTTILASVIVLSVITVIGGNAARSLRRLSGKLREMEAGNLQVELHSGRSDEIGRLFGASASMRDSLRETLTEAENEREDAESARQEAEQARTLAEEKQTEAERAKRAAETTASRLEATAEEYRQVMDDCADGDLTQRLDADVDSEAMVAIAGSFNDMIAEWETTLAAIRSFADEVAAESQIVTASTEEVTTASEDVSEATQEISDGAIEQSENLDGITGEMSTLSATIEEMASSADEVATTSETAAERGESGREAATAAIDEMGEIEIRAEETAEEVAELRDEVAHIGEIVELIEDIAEQTNILALNASIEAARAGEAGQGFAVVADEVKTLAEETKDATDDVAKLVDSVQDQADEATEGVHDMETRVEAGTATIETTAESLKAIVETVEDANVGVQEIREATNEQASSTQEVVTMVDEVADVADGMSGRAQNAAAAAEEQAASLTEVSGSAEDLATEAADLTDLLSEFEVSDDVAGGGTNDTVSKDDGSGNDDNIYDGKTTEKVVNEASEGPKMNVVGDGFGGGRSKDKMTDGGFVWGADRDE